MFKIGHRGAKGHVPENTLLSFQKAMVLGVDGIELDVHLSADGKIMVIHDVTIDKTTTGTGFVKNLKAAQLQSFGIPTLEEVLQLVNKRGSINIEIKDANATDLVLQLIEKYISENNWNYQQFQISSFDWTVLEKVAQQNTKILIGVLTDTNLDEVITFAKKINAYSIHPFFKLLNKEKVTLLQQNGFSVFPWTVNNPEDIQTLKSFNVDGIISDFPERL